MLEIRCGFVSVPTGPSRTAGPADDIVLYLEILRFSPLISSSQLDLQKPTRTGVFKNTTVNPSIIMQQARICWIMISRVPVLFSFQDLVLFIVWLWEMIEEINAHVWGKKAVSDFPLNISLPF